MTDLLQRLVSTGDEGNHIVKYITIYVASYSSY